jgi:hypothetical protein
MKGQIRNKVTGLRTGCKNLTVVPYVVRELCMSIEADLKNYLRIID